MKTNATCPDPPGAPEKENGPTHRTNDKKDQSSENAHQQDSDNANDSQVDEAADESVSLDTSFDELLLKDADNDDEVGLDPEALTSSSILSMRLPASELAGVATKLVRPKITVDRPPNDQFFMVKEGQDYWVPFGLLQVERTSSSYYLVAPGTVRDWMLEEGIKSFFDCVLCLAVTRHGEPRVWPLKQTDNSWHTTAREIAEMAKKSWVKLISDQTAGYYVAGMASNQNKEPAWPEESFSEILEKAFAGRIIDSLDHEVIKELRGDD